MRPCRVADVVRAMMTFVCGLIVGIVLTVRMIDGVDVTAPQPSTNPPSNGVKTTPESSAPETTASESEFEPPQTTLAPDAYQLAASAFAEEMRQRMERTTVVNRPFRFHIYPIPSKYIDGALELMASRWSTSVCNRRRPQTTYTMLDWRHAHSLFTADVFIAKYLRYHPNHTDDPREADVFIVPTMSHVYNCAGVMHYLVEILQWVYQHPYIKIFDQHDHYVFWWRWGMHFNSVQRFWRRVQRYAPNMNVISFELLEIMGRNVYQDFSLALKPKFFQSAWSVVVPYPDFSPALRSPADPHGPRPLFFYFAGTSTIGGVRRWIKKNCDARPEDCTYVEFGRNVTDPARLGVPADYPTAMKSAVFCGHAAGDGLSSRRPTSAVLAGCIPVLICDLCLYAWEGIVDYASFAVFVPEEVVMTMKLVPFLKNITAERIAQLREGLKKVRHHFVYNTSAPPTHGDALDTLVDVLSTRGRGLREYRRWFVANHRLSSNPRDYPIEPRPIRRYFR